MIFSYCWPDSPDKNNRINFRINLNGHFVHFPLFAYINQLNFLVLLFHMIVECKSSRIFRTTNITTIFQIVIRSFVAFHVWTHCVQWTKWSIAFGAWKWFCMTVLVARQLYWCFECLRTVWALVIARIWMCQQMMIVYGMRFESGKWNWRKMIILFEKRIKNK